MDSADRLCETGRIGAYFASIANFCFVFLSGMGFGYRMVLRG